MSGWLAAVEESSKLLAANQSGTLRYTIFDMASRGWASLSKNAGAFRREMVNHLVQRGIAFMPEPVMISELQVNAEVRGWLFAEEVQNRTAKNGKPFRQLKLRDRKGNEIMARQFDLPLRETRVPQVGKAVLIEGLIEEFQNNTQIKLTRAELDETAPLDLFVLGTRRNIDQLEDQFLKLMKKVQHARICYILSLRITVQRIMDHLSVL